MKIKVIIKQNNSESVEITQLFRYCSQNRLPYSEIHKHLETHKTYTKRVNDCKIVIERKDK